MKEFNKNLSICIPTYNGEEKVRENLESLIPKVSKYSLPIYISDNASTDNTESVVKEFIEKYPYIFYSKTIENIGADRNFERILKLSETNYSWLLGNDDLICETALKKVVEATCSETEYALICVNAPGIIGNRINEIADCEFTNYNEFMSKLGSHLTLMSALIFNKKILNLVDCSKYYDSYFIQTCIAYNGSKRSNLKVKWIDEVGVVSAKNVSCTFTNQLFYIFTSRLYNSTLLFDKIYTSKSKKIYARQHFKYLTNHPLSFLACVRKNDQLSFKRFFKFHKALRWTLKLRYRIACFLLCFIPKSLLKAISRKRRNALDKKRK